MISIELSVAGISEHIYIAIDLNAIWIIYFICELVSPIKQEAIFV